MLIVSEQLARELVSVEEAIRCVEQSFAAMARGVAFNYPVVREVAGYRDAVFGAKTGRPIPVAYLTVRFPGSSSVPAQQYPLP